MGQCGSDRLTPQRERDGQRGVLLDATLPHVPGGGGNGRATVGAVANFYALAELMEAAVFVVEGEEYRYANPAATRMTGYTREELVGMKFWEIVHPDEREVVRERGFARQAGVDVPQQLPYRLYTKSGATVWVVFSGTRIEHDGKPALLGTAVDISRHKEVEEALRRSEARLRRLVESNVLAVLVGDVHPDVVNVAGAFTPVPGGVGPLTIAMLMSNTVKAARMRRGGQPAGAAAAR